MNPKIIGAVVAVVLVGGGSFYAGMVYAKSNGSGRGSGQFGQQFVQGGGSGPGGGRGFRGGAGGGFIAGEVLSMDDKSLTIKGPDGSTKIVFIGSSTQVMKTSAGALSDIAQGSEVSVMGTANQDGSLTAQSVSIRPLGSGPFGTSTRTRLQ